MVLLHYVSPHAIPNRVLDRLESPRQSVTEGDHILEAQFQLAAERSQCSEGRPAATCEEVAQRTLVDVSLSRQVAARPTPKDSCLIKRGDVDRPFQAPL